MSASSSCASFSSRAAGVRALRLQRLSAPEIAERLGCTVRQVQLADWHVRQTERGAELPATAPSVRLVDLLPNDPDAKAKARKAAARRGLSLEGLIRQAVELLIEDDLWSAVLDDGDGWEAAR